MITKSRWTDEEIDFLIAKRKEGWTLLRIAEALPGRSLEAVKDKWKRLRRAGAIAFLAAVEEKGKQLQVPLVEEYGQLLRFGVISDTHFGSKYIVLEALERLPFELKKEGAQFFLHCGDLLDGQNVYPKQYLDQIETGADEQLALAVKQFPNFGLRIYGVGGNHDHSFMKLGLDNLKRFCSLREEFTLLGYFQGDIPLTKELKIKLYHPKGKLAKTRGRSLQHPVDLFLTERPALLFIGHYHFAYLAQRHFDIWAFLIPSFQRTTPYLVSQTMKSHVGATLITVEIKDDGALGPISWKFYPWP